MTRLAIALSIFLGCSSPPEPLQDAPGTTIAPPPALTTVLTALGAPERAPGPRVRLIVGVEACKGVAWIEEGKCVRGMFTAARPDEVSIAVWDGAAWSQTSLTHEALHWLLWHSGIASFDHPGDFYARVDRVNEILWRSGQ